MAARAGVVVWQFKDGKPGHENQTTGLIEALSTLLSVQVCEFRMRERRLGWLRQSLRGKPPAPDLLVGAGHGVHFAMLAARLLHGGRTVVLMKPSMPLGWFDLCIVPGHDKVAARANVLRTKGVLNRVRPGTPGTNAEGLILIGGPSAHHGWCQPLLMEQLEAILRHPDGRNWTIATSRRTPAPTREALTTLLNERVAVFGFDDVGADWLPERLGRASAAWVTEDSVSMIYEALTAGLPTGLLAVPRLAEGRVQQGLSELVAEGLALPFERWHAGEALAAPTERLDEATRCARWLVDHWLPGAVD